MIAVVDPRQAAGVMVGEGHAPLWLYLSHLQTLAGRAGDTALLRHSRAAPARAPAPALRSLCSESLGRAVRGLAPQPRFAADAETGLQGLVFGSVFSGRPDEHGSDDRQRYEDHDERDDSGNAGHSRQCCTEVSESEASSASSRARPLAVVVLI
jgi:hypothetical protein